MEPLVDRTLQKGVIEADELHLLLDELQEVHRVVLGLPAMLAHRVDRRLEEVRVRDSGNLDRVLKGEKNPLAGALFGRHVEEILAVEERIARGSDPNEYWDEARTPLDSVDKTVSDLLDLRGKKAIVTGGAGRNLGQACVNRLAGLGADVAVLDLSPEQAVGRQRWETPPDAEAAAAAASEKWGAKVIAVHGDVTQIVFKHAISTVMPASAGVPGGLSGSGGGAGARGRRPAGGGSGAMGGTRPARPRSAPTIAACGSSTGTATTS